MKGEPGAKGERGGFLVKDATDRLLGELVSAGGGLFTVRNTQGVLLNYSMTSGQLLTVPDAGLGNALFYLSTDCTGTPLVSVGLQDAGLINHGQLYRAASPYVADVTRHSERDFTTGVCSAVNGTGDFMSATLVGAAPVDAVLPLRIE